MTLKTFDEYLMDGIVKRQSPDVLRARALISESEDSYKVLLSFVEKVGIDDENANHIIKNAYDIVMELVRAKMLSDGFGTEGKGAHEAEISYMTKIGINIMDVNFSNELRYFRNGITYYGKKFGKEYAEKVLAFLKRMIPIIKKMCK